MNGEERGKKEVFCLNTKKTKTKKEEEKRIFDSILNERSFLHTQRISFT